MTESYNPLNHSVVQAVSGTWCSYEADDFIEALFMAILKEIKRVHWNVYQHSWGPSWHADEIEDPEITGILFTRYYDGCKCEDEPEHRPDCRHAKPNFQHEDVQFRWYKYPGRGMSTNKDWTPTEWRDWFGRCLNTVKAFEGDHYSEANRARREQLQASLRERYPDVFNKKYLDNDPTLLLFSAFDRLDKAQTPCWVCSEAGFGSGGGVFEGGPHGTIARTLHEDDNPDGPCVNCGHVNTDQQRAELDTRRRQNSDDDKAKWDVFRKQDERREAARKRLAKRGLAKLTAGEREALRVMESV